MVDFELIRKKPLCDDEIGTGNNTYNFNKRKERAADIILSFVRIEVK